MTSVASRTRQVSNDTGYFISISSCVNVIFTSPQGVVAPWASTGTGATYGELSSVVSTVNRTGILYKDMGKTVVSSGAFFRKIQLVVPQGANTATQVGAGTTSTFGVGGGASGSGVPDFYTGYVRLGFEGQGVPAPLAVFGR